jgi:hypothetical protein
LQNPAFSPRTASPFRLFFGKIFFHPAQPVCGKLKYLLFGALYLAWWSPALLFGFCYMAFFVSEFFTLRVLWCLCMCVHTQKEIKVQGARIIDLFVLLLACMHSEAHESRRNVFCFTSFVLDLASCCVCN